MSARKIRQKTASGRPPQRSAKLTSDSGRSTSSYVVACVIGVGAAAALSYTGLYDLGSGLGESLLERFIGKEDVFEGIPPQAVFVDPISFTVLGEHSPASRNDSFTTLFNPTNSTPPFFQIFHPSFITSVLGPNAVIRSIASNSTFSFAHEAPIWDPETDQVWFSSNAGGALGMSGWHRNSVVSRIDLGEVEMALEFLGEEDTGAIEVGVTQVDLPEEVQMTNGGTGPYKGNLVLINSGRGTRPPNIVLVNPKPPHNVTVLLDNFYGRQFNSLNDIKLHPTNGKFYFTDVIYGWLYHFRPEPILPIQLYSFDPKTGIVRAVADDFDKCNGLAFSADGKKAYVADTGSAGGLRLGKNHADPASIYEYDVDPRTGTFRDRRVFAYIDTGIPDGLQFDTQGNLYAGCGDGVHVFNPDGVLLGKFFVGTTSANMVFAGKGRMVIMAETEVYLVSGLRVGGLDLAGFV